MIVETLPNISEHKSARLLKALVEISQELSSTVDLEELLARLLSIARDVFRFENAIIRLLDEDGVHLSAVAAYGYTDEAIKQTVLIGQGVMGRVALTQQPILVEDVRQLPDYVAGIPGARCELAVPLINHDKLVGVFNVESPRPGAFSAEDIDPLLTLSRQAAISIENARLYERLRSMSEENRQLNQLNERILKSVNLGIYTVDVDLRITSWNRRMAEMSGLTADEAIGSLLPERFPVLVKEGVVSRIKLVLQSGRKAKLRLLHRNLDGTFRFQKRRLAPLHDGDEVTGVVVIVEDITEFKKLLEQTIQTEKLAEVGRLSASIAHEINNPLALVAYATQLIRRDGPLNAFQEEMAEKIETEVNRMKNLTGGLLSFSSNREAHHRLVDLNELIVEVCTLLRFEMQRNSIRLETDFETVPVINADPNKLKQVLINLVMNAAQAMNHDGEVVLSTRKLSDNMLELIVRDQGPGIDVALQETIFEPFVTTKPEGEGTGLGLYICRNIIREHAGTITVESCLGEGAAFRIQLPID